MEVFGCPLHPDLHLATAIQDPTGKLIVIGNSADERAKAYALNAASDEDVEGMQNKMSYMQISGVGLLGSIVAILFLNLKGFSP